MPGVQICHFSLTRSSRNGQLPIPVVGSLCILKPSFVSVVGFSFILIRQSPIPWKRQIFFFSQTPHGFSPASVAQTCVVYWWR